MARTFDTAGRLWQIDQGFGTLERVLTCAHDERGRPTAAHFAAESETNAVMTADLTYDSRGREEIGEARETEPKLEPPGGH